MTVTSSKQIESLKRAYLQIKAQCLISRWYIGNVYKLSILNIDWEIVSIILPQIKIYGWPEIDMMNIKRSMIMYDVSCQGFGLV